MAIYTAYRRWKVARFKDKSNKDVFTEIYNTNYWNSAESISGEGSELKQVEVLINELNKLIQERQIKTLLDVPCGDFNWMKKVDLSNVQYQGGVYTVDLTQWPILYMTVLLRWLTLGCTLNRSDLVQTQ